VYTKLDERDINSSDLELSFGGDFDMGGQTHTFMMLAEYRKVAFDFTEFPFDWLGSVDQFNPDFSEPADNLNLDVLTVSNGQRTDDQDRYALGAQVLLRASDKWSFLLGVRWDQVKQSLVDIKFDPDPDDDVVFDEHNLSSSGTTNSTTFRGGIVYALTDEINAYVSYSEGFLPQEGITRGGAAIDPEEGYQVEAGLKGEFLDRKLGASLIGFFIQREKVGIPDPTNDFQLGEDFSVQGGEQQHWGIELEVLGTVAENLNIIATYAFLETEVTKDGENLDFGDSALGNPVIGAPEHSGSLFFEYDIQSGSNNHWSVNAGASYVGERPSAARNLIGAYPGFSDGFPIFYFDSYTTVDLGVNYYGLENVVLSLQAHNVFDEDYFNPAQLDADCCGANFLQRGTSREIVVGITYGF
jgi:iron complex outermembrane receptor protein